MPKMYVIILLAVLAQATMSLAALPANLNGDIGVNFTDFAILAGHWQHDETGGIGDIDADGVVDWQDLAILADSWLDTEPGQLWSDPPVATNVAATVTQYLLNRITLVGTDDGYPNPPAKLKYVITSLPTDGQLYDMAPGGMAILTTPHTLLVNTPYVSYYTTATTPSPVTFGYKVNDYGTSPYGGDSAEATVTLTKAAYVKDNLSFDGRGYVTVADNVALDATNFNLYFWLRTTRPYGGILSKREPNGPGVEIKLWHGCPTVILYDNDGDMIAAVSSPLLGGRRIDTGQWFCVAMAVYAGQIEIGVRDEAMNMYGSVASLSTAGFTTDNAGPLLIGTDGQRGFNGSIDRVAMWKNPSGPSFLMAGAIVEARTGTTWTFATAPTLEWRFAEGTGGTVTDSKLGLVGTFNDASHVTWYPQGLPSLNIVPGVMP